MHLRTERILVGLNYLSFFDRTGPILTFKNHKEWHVQVCSLFSMLDFYSNNYVNTDYQEKVSSDILFVRGFLIGKDLWKFEY